MARARKPTKSTKSVRAAASRRAPAPAALAALASLERDVLALAQRLAEIAAEAEPPATSLRSAIELLLARYLRGGALATHLAEVSRAAAADKRTALALAWAREQLRLAITDVLAREAKADRLRPDVPFDALAWMVLAGSEAVMHEPPESAADRVDAIVAVAERPR